MPKPTKLHSKGKPNSIQKPCKVEKEMTANKEDESLSQFRLELCWCIQQLERSLNEKKGNEKQMQEAWKVLTVLKNNNQPMIRKRQLMRTHFGDYRAKMASEEKKLAKMASKMKITESPAQPKATFLRKSLFSTTGNTFKFNFDLAQEAGGCSAPVNSEENVSVCTDSCDEVTKTSGAEPSTNVVKTSSNNDNSSTDSNASSKEANSNTIVMGDDKASTDVKHMVPSSATCAGDSNIQNPATNNALNFKFQFSKSEFKFNFDVAK